jgi:molybdate transport system regulatory protein
VLVDETNRCLAQPAVSTATGGERGGGAALTACGAAFLAAYRAIEQDARDGVDARLAPFLGRVPPRAARRR